MANPFIGEIRIFAGNFAPQNWAFCDGRVLSISEYDTLFSLIGTTYGGDGVNTFALPDLRSRVPVSAGQGPGLSNYTIGQIGGVETVTLTTNQMPLHTHTAGAKSIAGDSSVPAGNVIGWAQATGNSRYSTGTPNSSMSAGAISPSGGNQPHDNMVPVQCINYIISLYGIYPPRN